MSGPTPCGHGGGQAAAPRRAAAEDLNFETVMPPGGFELALDRARRAEREGASKVPAAVTSRVIGVISLTKPCGAAGSSTGPTR